MCCDRGVAHHLGAGPDGAAFSDASRQQLQDGLSRGNPYQDPTARQSAREPPIWSPHGVRRPSDDRSSSLRWSRDHGSLCDRRIRACASDSSMTVRRSIRVAGSNLMRRMAMSPSARIDLEPLDGEPVDPDASASAGPRVDGVLVSERMTAWSSPFLEANS